MQLFDEENLTFQEQDTWENYGTQNGIIDNGAEDLAYNMVLRRELLHHIDNMMLRLLTEREKSIVERYFGLGCDAQNIERIAQDMGLQEHYVSTTISQSIIKLRESDDSIYLYQYLRGKRI